MKLPVQSLIGISTLALTLSSCSMMGTRKDATKVDLDGDPITQMKVIRPDSSGLTKKNAAEEGKQETADLTKGESVAYATQFVHPSISAEKYVKDNKINFWQISGNKSFMQETKSSPLPQDLDRASYFFGLGGKLSGDLKIVKDLTDDQKSWMNYDDQKVSEIQAKMIEKDPTCDGHMMSLAAAGEVSVRLDDTNIEEILQNTKIDSSSDGKTLRDMLKTIDPQTKSEEKVPVVYFKNLNDKTQTQIKGSFDPNLGTLSFPIASGIELCDSKTPQAYVIDMGEYTQIDPKDVSITEEGGQKKYVINLKKHVTSAQIQKFKGTGNKSLKDLTFGLSDLSGSEEASNPGEKLPVFNEQQPHEQHTQYTFYTNPNGSTKQSTKTAEQPKANAAEIKNDQTIVKNEPDIVVTEVDDQGPGSVPAELNSNDLPPGTKVVENSKNKKEESGTPNTNGQNNTVVSEIPDALKPNEKLNEKNKILNNNDKNTVKNGTLTAKSNTPPSSIARVPEVVTKFSKNVTVAYDPKLNGIAFAFYPGGKYNAGEHNASTSGYWQKNNAAYTTQAQALKEQDVNAACSAYQFDKKVSMNVSLKARSNTAGYYNGKSYAQVLGDQIYADVEVPAYITSSQKDDIVKQIVNAILHIPSPSNSQKWDMRICFDPKNGFVGFWTSDETKKTYSYKDGVLSYSNGSQSKWIKASTISESNLNTPPNFNPLRKTMPSSLFSIRCKKNDPSDCVGIFQLGIKRAFDPARLMSYLDLTKIQGVTILGMVTGRNDILDGLNKGFTKIADGSPKVNRLGIHIFGGFKFDPNSKTKGTEEVQFLSLKDLLASGYISSSDMSGNFTGKGMITFDGALSEYNIYAN